MEVRHCHVAKPTVAKSSTEAEYRAMSETTSEITWLVNLLRDLGVPQLQKPELFCDNLSAVYLMANPAFHPRTKHFATHYHYVREQVAFGELIVNHIPGHLQLADIFTKSLATAPFESLRFKLGVDFPPPPSLRGSINTTTPNGIVLETGQGRATLKPNTKQVLSESKAEPKSNNVQRLPPATDKNRVSQRQSLSSGTEVTRRNRYAVLGSCANDDAT